MGDPTYFKGDRHQFICDEEAQAEGDLRELLHEMSNSDRKEVMSRLAVLLMHMLKKDHQPERATASWDITITGQQRELEILFDQSPSLKRYASTIFEKAYATARKYASKETKLPIATFPEECPWSEAEVFGEDD